MSQGKVATAHTASDNLETMIFNLTRGTSLKGLSGIPVKRGIYIRPLILCTRQNVEDYCKENEISFDDWMALDLKYIEERSFRVDWKIIFLTLKAVICKQGE